LLPQITLSNPELLHIPTLNIKDRFIKQNLLSQRWYSNDSYGALKLVLDVTTNLSLEKVYPLLRTPHIIHNLKPNTAIAKIRYNCIYSR
jgi:hypothetical protein